jgi:hypothetical protein
VGIVDLAVDLARFSVAAIGWMDGTQWFGVGAGRNLTLLALFRLDSFRLHRGDGGCALLVHRKKSLSNN